MKQELSKGLVAIPEPTLNALKNLLFSAEGIINVTPIVNDAQIKPINQTNSILKNVESAIAKNNINMSDFIKNLSQDVINAMHEEYMSREVSLYVDGRKMASTLAQPMSREFKVLSNRGL